MNETFEKPHPMLEVRNLRVEYPVKGGILNRIVGRIRAVDGVSFSVTKGETLGLVGESGCGKSTLSRALVRLVAPASGEILFEGNEILRSRGRESKRLRRDIQIIFQDPVGSLNPSFRVRDLILEGMRIQNMSDRRTEDETVASVLEKVGLRGEIADRYPHEISGGQRQRIGIARTLVLAPKLIIADEPVSALDVSIQAQVLNLLADLRRDLGLTYVFIAHNLAVVGYIADRIAVMYHGKIVEIAGTDEIRSGARHPYTIALLSSVPSIKTDSKIPRIKVAGEMPSSLNPPSGCRFRLRCHMAQDRCTVEEPALAERTSGHLVACHFQ